ncbi:MAG: glycosyltransferase family 2 protein [Candidatus Methanomethylophilaceae archaeon]|nr:glycosyltransferase family 2 protein [Candidatus Methanomethylophilaceae archaeon]
MVAVILQHLDFSRGAFGPEEASPTYLNCVPLSKYRKYCGIQKVTVRFDTCLDTPVKIRYLFLNRDTEEETVASGSTEFVIDHGDVIAISPQSGYLKGTVEADVENVREVRLEHVVCTYHREKEALDRIDLFRKAGLKNYHMTMVDNGSTIEADEDDIISIVRSPNLGGSSGFARGMAIGLERKSTHILLNDDDAYLNPESVFRTIQFLSVVLPEYEEYSISGVFLDIDNPNCVREIGGLFRKGNRTILKNGADISTEKGILSISEEQHIDYSSWTCCCIPSSVVEKCGLPLPLFVSFDDTEYGLRLKGRFIVIPGITTWHQSYYSYPLRHRYYDMRNRLVTAACSGGLNRESVNNIFDAILSEIAAYRYDCSEEMIKGVYDFMKGPEYVFGSCTEGMHKTNGLELEESEKLRESLRPFDRSTSHSKKARFYTMNGLFLPSFGDMELDRC